MARRIIGYSFVVAAIIGLIFSIAGIALVWSVKGSLSNKMVGALDLISTTLDATSSGLDTLDNTLTGTISQLTSLEQTLQTASKGVDDTVPMVDTMTGLLTSDIPLAIDATQTGLATLQEAAGALETTLQLVTSIPFLPIEPYDPDTPLTEAIDGVSQSLDAIPNSLSDMKDPLKTTTGNLTMLAAQLKIISRGVSDLKADLYEMQLVLGQYKKVISRIQKRVNAIQTNLDTIINVSAWVFTVIFVWLGIAQLGLLTQGLERIQLPSQDQGQDEEDSQEEDFPTNETIPKEGEEVLGTDNPASSGDE
ncbi:MAG: hypothetical protein JSV42_08160 [Chloroflexota bacterium]|nr:MAG: hypothetical protein JSV42_08160 [Chloroflexota bacterium]